MSPAGSGSSAPAPGASSPIRVGAEPIDPNQLYLDTRCDRAGAVVQFCGTVRDHNRSARVVALEYEAYREMAHTSLTAIVAEARRQWPCEAMSVAHRTGELAVGDVSVCVTVAAAHRDAAFAACRYVIDRLKASAPIWKRETLESGSRRWIEEAGPPEDAREA